MKVFYSENDDALRRELFSRIRKDMEDGPAFGSVLLVVPAQMTLSMEEEALASVDPRGFFRLNIVSGGKLRQDILEKTGGSGRVAIDTIGRKMLLRRVINKVKGELTAFQGICLDPGFLDMAGDFLVQMKQNRVDADILQSAAEKETGLLGRKLADMALIAKGYADASLGKLEDSEDILAFTTQKLDGTTLLKNVKIYYCGFYSFTKNEMEFLRALDRNSAGLQIALVCGEGEEFKASVRTIRLLGVPAEKIPAEQRAKPFFEIVQCANTYTQAETIAIRMLKLVREKGYKYSDMAVLAPEGHSSAGMIKRVLTDLGIPVFMDETRSIMHSSAAELVSALLDLSCGEYKTRDIVRFVKTGILGAPEETVFRFEKYAWSFHIKGKRFLKPFKYSDKNTKAMLPELEALRKVAASAAEPLVEKLSLAKTAGEKTEVFTEYLNTDLGFEKWLEETAARQNEDGFEDSAEQTRQLAGVIKDIAQQIIHLIGDESVSAEEFRGIFMDALKDVKIGVLPQAEGKVQIGSVKRSIIQDKKAVFFATFCDGLVPSSPGSFGVLTEKEISGLEKKDVPLAKPSDLLISEELFMLFRSAACAKELLWIGLPSTDLEGGEYNASPALGMLKSRCSGGPGPKDAKDPAASGSKDTNCPEAHETKDAESTGDQTAFLEGARLPLEKLSVALRDGLSGEEVPELWKAVYNELSAKAPQVKEGLLFDPAEPPLDKKLAERLFSSYDGSKSLSPSRLDLFASCPFKHFMTYGLRPVEDADFTITGREMGDMIHEALLKLSEKLSSVSAEKGIAMTDPKSLWMTVSPEELDSMLKEILDGMAQTSLSGIMQSSKEEMYRSERILDTCSRFARHLIHQVRSGNIERMYFETPFKREGTFGPIELSTSTGTVYVEGKIDRVDILPGADGEEYVKIIDYKSGSDRFIKGLVEEGLKMQLMTYLEGALGSGGRPAGVYYFRINADDVAASVEDLLSDDISEKVLNAIEKEYRLDGVTVAEGQVIRSIDKGFDETGESTVVNLKRHANGNLGGSFISPEDMEEFRAQFRRNLLSVSERLFSGDIKAQQKKRGNDYDSCAYCDYASICLKSIRV